MGRKSVAMPAPADKSSSERDMNTKKSSKGEVPLMNVGIGSWAKPPSGRGAPGVIRTQWDFEREGEEEKEKCDGAHSWAIGRSVVLTPVLGGRGDHLLGECASGR